jgi:hypothetical protein
MTLTKYRQDIFNLTDKVIETGIPLEIERNGVKVIIHAEKKKSKLDNLKKRDLVVGDSDDLIYIDWSKEWNPDDNV